EGIWRRRYRGFRRPAGLLGSPHRPGDHEGGVSAHGWDPEGALLVPGGSRKARHHSSNWMSAQIRLAWSCPFSFRLSRSPIASGRNSPRDLAVPSVSTSHESSDSSVRSHRARGTPKPIFGRVTSAGGSHSATAF